MLPSTSKLFAAGLGTLILATLLSAPATAQQRSGAAPCRQGALALIAMLDNGETATADYRHAFAGVTESCGAITPGGSGKPPGIDAKACRAMALKMLDEIEEGRFARPSFARARDDFAKNCAPA